MADRKTVTRQTFIGEKGIALIERRCLEMGHLFFIRGGSITVSTATSTWWNLAAGPFSI
ncbi:hypothetical protein GCM10020256_11700 [Streptomyces thermocoprophilus]